METEVFSIVLQLLKYLVKRNDRDIQVNYYVDSDYVTQFMYHLSGNQYIFYVFA